MKYIITFLFSSLIFSACTAPCSPPEEIKKMEITALDGKILNWDDFFDKPIVINYWATYCIPCRNEMPAFFECEKEYSDRVNFIYLSNESIEVIRKFIDISGFKGNFIHADTFDKSIVTEFPITQFVNRSCQVIKTHKGAMDKNELKSTLDFILD